MKGIADAGFIVAFGNRNDRHHAWAVEVAKRIQDPLLTCEAVLAEAAFHLASSAYVLSLVRDKCLGWLLIAPGIRSSYGSLQPATRTGVLILPIYAWFE